MFRITDKKPEKLPKLDVKDKKLLVLLSENSRMATTQLAKKVQLARDTTAYRMQRMQKLGIIQGFYPEIHFSRLGYHKFRALFLIDETNKERQQLFIDTLRDHPNTLNLREYSDRWDIELQILAKNIIEFDEIITSISAKFSDIIMEKLAMANIDTYRSVLFPFKDIKPIPKEHTGKNLDYVPDKKDLEILKELAKDARQSTYDIAKHVKLSADAIGLRIRRLLESDVIHRFTVLPNLSMMGFEWFTFAMQVKVFDDKAEKKFDTFVKDHPYIWMAVKTLGTWDLLIYIISREPGDYHKTIKQIKNEFADIIKNYDSWVAYREIIFNPMPKVISG